MDVKPSQNSRLDLVVGYILLSGVLLSAAFLLAGILWRGVETGSPELHATLSGTNLFRFWLSDIQQAASGQFSPKLLINVGIAALLMTPFIRVGVSMLYFAVVERNIKYTVFTGFVLAVLTYSLFLH